MSDIDRTGAMQLLVRRLSAHSQLGDEEKSALLALPSSLAPVKAHIDFVHAGTRLDYSCLVADGLIARFEQLDDGRRQIISLHIPGDFVDLQSMLLPAAPTGLQALCPSRIVKMPHTALRQAITSHPELITALWRDTVVDAMGIAQSVVRVGRRNAYARVAHLLCEMSVRYERIGAVRSGRFAFPITQEQLGNVLGLTSVHVNRTLRALKTDGLASMASGRVEITDHAGLRRASGFDAAYLSVRRAA